MNEIEKLYKLAGVETNPYCCDTSCGEPTKECKDCADYREVYPPFTAEKQLELIKFLSWHFEYGIKITKYLNGFSMNNYTGSRCSELSKTFDESLASIVNKIWQDLTEEEKKQIKEILE